MKNLIEKDKKLRIIYKKYETKKKVLNFLCNNLYLSNNIREQANIKQYKLTRNSALVRTRNRCVLTARGRAVYKQFRLCRNMFRFYALSGELPGVKKTSW